MFCILTSPGRTLTAVASASSAASGLWACPGSWCQSSRWETPGCQWLKSTPAFRLECSSCSSGRPCPRNTSPKPRSKHRWDQKYTNDGVTGASGMFFFLPCFPSLSKNAFFIMIPRLIFLAWLIDFAESLWTWKCKRLQASFKPRLRFYGL